ncbi:MAG: L-histidine N(alpha)-methyltransferase [FCB group bacterium]|nr:L-histidine N(alpha)-methyltransferase [FCB group bacterium]
MTETLRSPQIIKAQDQFENPTMAFAKDVLQGLNKTPKRLSSVYFYDERGSQIFEDICELEEYYLTRKETEILQRSAAEIISKLPPNTHLVELGSGNSTKTKILLEAAIARFGTTQYSPIDVSAEILTETVNDLNQRYPELQVEAVAGRYEFGMEYILKNSTTSNCIMWLGSSIGNLSRVEAAQFLGEVRKTMSDRDSLLLGIDLRKGPEILEPAYDDAQGVTADFNLNLLDRINSELGGTFERKNFHHQAVYNVEEGRIEMYLVSNIDQEIEIKNIGVRISFHKDEKILTEYSYKYSHAEINALAEASGFFLEQQWLDDSGWFSLNCFKPQTNAPELRALYKE